MTFSPTACMNLLLGSSSHRAKTLTSILTILWWATTSASHVRVYAKQFRCVLCTFWIKKPTPNVLQKQAYRVSSYSSRVYTWITNFKLDQLSKKMILNFIWFKRNQGTLYLKNNNTRVNLRKTYLTSPLKPKGEKNYLKFSFI